MIPVTTPVMRWAGRVLSALFVLFMAFDVAIKLIRLPVVAETLRALGWPGEAGFAIGVVEAICVLLYVLPRTALLGAVLMTAVLGGAVASQARIANPLFTHLLFGVYLGLAMWGGLWLRDGALRAVFPWDRAMGRPPPDSVPGCSRRGWPSMTGSRASSAGSSRRDPS